MDFYEKLRIWVGLIFSKIPIHQNFWTALVIFLAFVGFLLFVIGEPYLAVFVFLVSGFFDIVDGGVTAVRSGESNFGKWFSDLSNKGVECLFLLGLQFVAFPDFILKKDIAMSLLFIYAFLFSYIKSNGYYRKIIKKEIKTLPGFERGERIIPLYVGVLLHYFNPIYLSYLVMVSIVISTIRPLLRAAEIINVIKL
ncbi:MAG: CDP-alcohol phosphatidyltransferase family protein [Candidatus Micrarchaeia archaeon]